MLHFTSCFLVAFHCHISLFSSLYFKFLVIATALMAIEIDVAAVVGVAVEEGVVVVEVGVVVEVELVGMQPIVILTGLVK